MPQTKNIIFDDSYTRKDARKMNEKYRKQKQQAALIKKKKKITSVKNRFIKKYVSNVKEI